MAPDAFDDSRKANVSGDAETRFSRKALAGRAAAVGVTIAGAGSLAAGAAQAAPRKAAGSDATSGTLRFRGAAMGNLDPADWGNFDDFVAGQAIFEGLIGYQASTKWVRENRTAVRVEPSADGLRYKFELKKGIEFHRGYGELTAEDVKFTYERLAKEPHAYSFEFDALDRVKLDGTHSGTIILKRPYVPFMSTALPWIPGHIISKKAVTKLGKKFSSNPIGTGPYEFVSYTPNQKLVLKRFANWHGSPAPLWDTIELVSTPDDTAATNAYLTGALDMGVAPIAEADHLSSSSKFQLVKRTSLNYAWVGMNVKHPNLTDINLRRAIRAAIDVPSIITAAFDGKYQRANSLLAPGMPTGYWKNAPVYDRDVDKAKAFLAKAKSKPKLEFTVFDITGGAKTVGEIVQDNLKDIGLDVKLVNRQYGNGVGKRMRANQLFFMSYAGTAPDPNSSTVWFDCGQAKDLFNLDYWCDPTYTKMGLDAVKQTDPAKRNAAYIKMQQIMDKSASAVWVAWPAQIDVVPKGVTSGLLPDGTPLLWKFKKG